METIKEEREKIDLYYVALIELAAEDQKFTSNRNIFVRWNNNNRIWWIEQIEAQAQAGANTLGATVVARAMAIRLST